ncbi:MAG: LCP family protein [Candidatus Daviesbacteria bacterium]|nr:LCP family protein [Candidatus Daviesbacteria bacterium]
MEQIKFIPHQKHRKVIKILLVVLALILVFFLLRSLRGGSDFKFVFNTGPSIHSDGGRVNILLLGIGGENHDGPYLTDTVMVASVNFQNKSTSLISLPRDLWVEKIHGKINSAYEMGLARGQGLSMAKSVVGDILGIPIHFAFRLDFGGFIKAIDDIGGIDVDVDKSFDDYNYPIEGKENDLCGWTQEEKDFTEDEAKVLNVSPGKMTIFVKDGVIATDAAQEDQGNKYFSCRFEHISYKSGLTHMDGTTALKFVRSRHGTNGEGSDFARSARQEKVLQAVRSKMLSLETLVNPGKITSLINTFGKSIDTDLQIGDFLELYKIMKSNETTQSFVIGAGGKNPLLKNPPVGDFGGWVLIPTLGNGKYNDIHKYIQTILSREVNHEATASARPSY